MLANLWDVTDKDIDKFTLEFLSQCKAAAPGTFIPGLVQAARSVCKMKFLNGAAPVVYGLPLFINKN